MIISVINHTNGKISDEEVQFTLRAINRQIREDFEPYWSLGARLRLEGRSAKQPPTADSRNILFACAATCVSPWWFQKPNR